MRLAGPFIMATHCLSTHPNDLASSQRKTPVFLTSGACENAWGSPELFALLGLSGGEFDGEFYPLTKEESVYIGEDLAEGTTAWAYMGYSVVYQGRKWLAPTMEFDWLNAASTDGEEGLYPDEEAAEKAAATIQETLDPLFAEIGGMILRDDNSRDRISLLFLVPFDYAMRFADFEAWKAGLIVLLSGPPSEEEEKPQLAYVWTAKAWYVDTVDHPAEVMFGRYYKEGGCEGEMAIRWYTLGNQMIPRLECYSETFSLLLELQPILQSLTTLPDAFTQEQLVNLLKEKGFRDHTKYIRDSPQFKI